MRLWWIASAAVGLALTVGWSVRAASADKRPVVKALRHVPGKAKSQVMRATGATAWGFAISAIFGAVLGTAIVGSVLMHTLGTLPGLAAFAAFVALAVVGPKGILRFYFDQLDMDRRAAAYRARHAAEAGGAAAAHAA